MSDLVEVVGGIFVRNGRVLLQQRPADKDLAFCWECPGGKVNADDSCESHHSALRREWQEELDVRVGTICESPFWHCEFDAKKFALKRPVFLLFYFIEEIFGELQPREQQGLGWFTFDEMKNLVLTPGNVSLWECGRLAKAITIAGAR